MKEITSRDNALFKLITRLVSSARARRDEQKILLDGVHLVQVYLDRFGVNGMELMVKPSAIEHPEIAELMRTLPTTMLRDALFDEIAPVQTPVGVLAVVPLPTAGIARRDVPSFSVLLDGVQDPGNVGSILRSAAAAGAGSAYLSSACADPWAPKTLRGGMGAQFWLDVHTHRDLDVLAQQLNVKLVACSANAERSVFDSDLRGELAFVIGGEGAGVSAQLLERAGQTIRIPMHAGVESLNVGAAAAICFYEWNRQNRSALSELDGL